MGEDGTSPGVWWLNVNNPTPKELRVICSAFGIHPLTMEDIGIQESREKIELFPTYYFASFRSFKLSEQREKTKYIPFDVYVVVFREGTISFSYTPNSHASNVRSRIAMLKEHGLISSDWICYALIDDIVGTFFPELIRLELSTATIEDQIYITRPSDHQDFLQQINTARKDVLSLLRLLSNKPDALRAFTKRTTNTTPIPPPKVSFSPTLTNSHHDLTSHLTTLMHSLTHVEKILSRARTNALTRLTIEGIAQGTTMNRFLSRLNAVATVFLPLTVLCGLFGMNIMVPWKSAMTHGVEDVDLDACKW
ncbi:hypothetical protein N0V88_005585 [Collariella sp. IMI 366227]|nr:hypothetical protein N0V88_005585 [Collariella sp. IMI 366227]